MNDNFRICGNCGNGRCDLCEDSWESNGDEFYCVCDCFSTLDIEHEDILDEYRVSNVDEYNGSKLDE